MDVIEITVVGVLVKSPRSQCLAPLLLGPLLAQSKCSASLLSVISGAWCLFSLKVGQCSSLILLAISNFNKYFLMRSSSVRTQNILVPRTKSNCVFK